MGENKIENKKNIWKYIFYALAGVSLLMIIIASQKAGISGDEFFHTEHAKNVFNFYATGGQDSTATVVTGTIRPLPTCSAVMKTSVESCPSPIRKKSTHSSTTTTR